MADVGRIADEKCRPLNFGQAQAAVVAQPDFGPVGDPQRRQVGPGRQRSQRIDLDADQFRLGKRPRGLKQEAP